MSTEPIDFSTWTVEQLQELTTRATPAELAELREIIHSFFSPSPDLDGSSENRETS